LTEYTAYKHTNCGRLEAERAHTLKDNEELNTLHAQNVKLQGRLDALVAQYYQ